MPRRIIWTENSLRFLFEVLVRDFGPYRTWEHVSTPGYGHDARFKLFLRDFAKVVGAKSDQAVAHQIAFGTPHPNGARSHWREGQSRPGILCLAAAFHAGWIKQSELPNITAEGI